MSTQRERIEARLGLTGPPLQKLREAPPQIPDHQLVRRIGQGAYGEVWLARNALGTWRAVKVVYRDNFRDERPYEREFAGIRRFEPLSRSNEGFVDVLQVGRNDAGGWFYYVMELADDVVAPAFQPASPPPAQKPIGMSAFQSDTYTARTLARDLAQRGRLPLQDCLELGLTLTLALGHLHRHGLIHRDIKPSNIIFVGGVPKLADIGLVTEAQGANTFVGTEGFVPPEGPTSPQADLYALGKVLYEAAMGKDRNEFPEPFTQIGTDQESVALMELNAVLLRACAPDPKKRYASAEEMHADLALLQSGGSVKRRHLFDRQFQIAKQVGAVGIAATLLIGGAWLWQKQQTRKMTLLATEKSALATEKTKLADDLTKLGQENRNRIVRLDIANGVRLLDEGDPCGALLWFADALPLLSNNPAQESVHRIRIQQTLDQIPRLKHVLGHKEAIKSAAFSPDGKFLATGTEWGWLHLWDLQSGTPAWGPVNLQVDWISQLNFTHDGQRLLVSAIDTRGVEDMSPGTVITNCAVVIDARSGKQLFAKTASNVIRADFARDGRWLVTQESDHIIRVLDVPGGKEVATLIGQSNAIEGFSFSSNGTLLASTSDDGTCRLWRLPSGELLGSPIPHQPSLHPAVLSPDGHHLAIEERVVHDQVTNACIRIWKTEPFTNSVKPIEVTGEILDIEFDSATSRSVLVLSSAQASWIDADTGDELLHPIRFDKPIQLGVMSFDGHRAVFARHEGIAGVWNLQTGEWQATPFKQGRQIRDIALSPDASELVVHTDENAATLWTLKQRMEDATLRLGSSLANQDPRALLERFSKNRRRFLTTLVGGKTALVDFQSLSQHELPALRGYRVAQCRLDSIGKQWVISYAPTNGLGLQRLLLWHENSETPLLLESPQGPAMIRFTSDDKHLVDVADDRKVRIWKTEDGTLERTIPVPKGLDGGWCFPDGRTAFFEDSRRNGFALFDLLTGTVTPTSIPPANLMSPFVFDSTCERFATVTEQQWGRVWSTRTGEALTTAVRHGGALTWADWSLDDKRIVMAGETPEARVWDAATGTEVLPPLRLGEKPMVTAMWSFDSRFVVARSDEKLVRVWDASTGEPVTPILKHSDYVCAANLVTNNRLVTITKPDLIRVWDLNENTLSAELLTDSAKLLSGRKLNSAGGMISLKAEELAELNRSLRQRVPQLFE